MGVGNHCVSVLDAGWAAGAVCGENAQQMGKIAGLQKTADKLSMADA